jgi:antitoxin component of MazEF toxin-antitoxin module
MPAVRKIYKQGNTPIISLPPALVSAVGAGLGSTIAIYPVNATSLLFEVLIADDKGIFDLARLQQLRTIITRTIYRQGNSYVCSVSTFVLERIGVAVGDSLSLAQISNSAFTGTARSAAQVTMDKAQGRVSYRKMERANADCTLIRPPGQ